MPRWGPKPGRTCRYYLGDDENGREVFCGTILNSYNRTGICGMHAASARRFSIGESHLVLRENDNYWGDVDVSDLPGFHETSGKVEVERSADRDW